MRALPALTFEGQGFLETSVRSLQCWLGQVNRARSRGLLVRYLAEGQGARLLADVSLQVAR